MVKKSYQKIIFGATFLAAQMAARDPEKTLIVERGIMPGSDFCTPIIPTGFDKEPQTGSFARGLVENAKARNMENDPLSLASCLAKAMKDAGIRVLFGTAVVKVERQDHGFQILIHNEQGFSSLFAEKVTDTTSCGVAFQNPGNAKCAFSAILSGKLPASLPQDFEAFPLRDQPLFVLRVYCKPEFPLARKRIQDFVMDIPAESRPMIVSFAKEFAWIYESPYHSGGVAEPVFRPSVSFGTPWNALRAGLEESL